MTARRIVGMALIVVGIVLVVIGLNSTDSVADKVHEAFTGRYTQKTLTWILGGVGTSVVGAVVALLPARKGE